jgi:hypothetical protein
LFKRPPTYQHISWISAPKIDTDLLWTLSLVFGVLLLIYFVTAFYLKNSISKTNHRVRKKKRELSPMISEFLFYDEHGSKTEKINYIDLKIQIREMINYPFDRRVLTDVLMDLRKDVAGQSREDLFRLYKDLELHKDAYKKLESWRWEIISKGILELTQMQVHEAYGRITRFINDKRPTIRKQAEMATVTLKEEGINYFLDHTTYSISEWQQVKLIDELKSKEKFVPPPFRLWLTSRNTDVVLFTLRLIKHYQQNDAIDSIITLVQHKHPLIKKEAILCLRDFNGLKAVPKLKKVFRGNPEDIKMYILDALAHLGTADDIPFLQDIAEHETSFRVKNKALGAINTISPEEVLPFKDIEAHEHAHDIYTENTKVVSEVKVSESLNDTSLVYDIEASENDDELLTEIPSENKTSPMSIPENEHKANEGLETSLEDLSFLPLVTSNDEFDNNLAITKDLEGENTFFTLDFLPIVTPTKEPNTPIIPPKIKVEVPIKNGHIRDCPVQYEIIAPKISEGAKETPMAPIKQPLEELKVVFEEISIKTCSASKKEETYIEWSLAFQDESTGKNKHETTQDLNLLTLDFELDLKEKESIWMPKASFYEDEIMEKMILLNQIEELGDHREIGYLKELAETSESELVKKRIDELIDKFSHEAGVVNYFKVVDFEPIDSVFHELIVKSDMESKHILINEMAVIGDEKELPLLKTLMDDADSSIATAAQLAYDEVQERLLGHVPILDTDIAPARELNTRENTLFDALVSTAFENYGKDNG